MQEEPLIGGRTVAGIVRLGDTVRRPAGSHSTFVHSLLRHLEQQNFDAAPRSLGVDELGRDVLSYIDGQVPSELSFHGDTTLEQAARLIRRYHDATSSFLAKRRDSEVTADVVCHNDLSPCNFVFRKGRPFAVIDFDAAAPGSRYWDLGYAVWLWLDIGNKEIGAADQKRRLNLFVSSYDSGAASNLVVQNMLKRQKQMSDVGHYAENRELTDWAVRCFSWTQSNLV